MRFLRVFINIIQGIFLFLIPVIIFYWFLITLNLDMLKPFSALLGSFLDPFIEFVRRFASYEISYEGVTNDITPIIASFIILSGYFLLCGAEKTIDFAENKYLETQIKAKKQRDKKEAEIQKMQYLEDLAKNRVVYLDLKFHQQESRAAYLYSNDDIFSEGLVNVALDGVIESSLRYKGKKYENPDNPNGVFSFIFYDITDAIDFTFHVFNRTNEINKEIIDKSKKMSFSTSCHCSYSEENAPETFTIVQKLLNLAGENEILVSELFKNKYEALKEESNLKFISKGIYIINDDQMEVFEIKVEKQ